MTVKDALGSARARWWLPALGVVLGLVAAAVVTWQTTPEYRTSTQVLIGSTGSADAGDAHAAGIFAGQRALSYVQVAEGQAVLRRVAEDAAPDLTPAELRARISARHVPGTAIIEITVTDTSPARAQRIAAAAGSAFIEDATSLETTAGAVRSAVALSTVRSPERPTEPISPDAARNLSFGALAGLLAGLLVVALPGRSARTVTHRDDVREWSSADLLATLVQDGGPSTGGPGGDPDAAALVALRSRLFGGHDGPAPRVVVVTSAVAGEGRSAVAGGLAAATARAGHRVALVDADPLRPGVAGVLGLPDGPGLTDVLAGDSSLEHALRLAADGAVDVLTAGTVALAPDDVHGGPGLPGLLRTLRDSHDVVVVVGPPLSPVPDAAVLASCADGCLLVASHSRTGRDQLAGAAALLAGRGARLLGVVLTEVPARRARALGLRHDYPVDRTRRTMRPPAGRRIVAGSSSVPDFPAEHPAVTVSPADPGVS